MKIELGPDTTGTGKAIETYCSKYNIEPRFELSPIYALTTDNWKNSIPFHLDQGCYFFYAEDGALLYIGKASFKNDLAGRVITYFRTRPMFELRHDGWIKAPAFLQTVKVNFAYEAPSLEEYLIQELQPAQNKLGIRPFGLTERQLLNLKLEKRG